MKLTVRPLLLVLLALSMPAMAKDIYVSVLGLNTNAGSLDKPLRNIQTAINQAVAGDTVHVRAFNAAGAQAVYVERLTFSGRSGTADAPITLCGYAGDLKTDGTAAYPAIDLYGVAPANGLSAILTVVNCSYVTIAGLEFRNCITASEEKVPTGIYVVGRGTGVRLERNKVHHIQQNNTAKYNEDANGFGIAVYGSSSAGPIDQLVLDGNEVYSLRTGQSESVTLNGNVTNFQVINNTVHDCNNIGIDCIGFEQSLPAAVNFARSGLVRDNVVYNIDSQYNPGYGGNFSGAFGSRDQRNETRGAPGIYVDGGGAITVERNHVHHCNMGMSFSSEHAGRVTSGCIVRDNLISYNHVGGVFLGGAETGNGGTQNCSITNNTFYRNDTENYGGGSIAVQHHVSGTVIRQNIFVCAPGNAQFILCTSADSSFAAGAMDWNLYSGVSSGSLEFIWRGRSYGSFAAWKAGSGQDAHSPYLTSPASLFGVPSPVTPADFALSASSPALNAGNPDAVPAQGETDFFGSPRLVGSGPDIGMVERGGVFVQIRVEHPSKSALISGKTPASFGNVSLSGSHKETFVIKNVGTLPLTGLSLSVNGANADEFVPDDSLTEPASLEVGASTTFSVTFTPTVEGTRTALLHINSNDPNHPDFQVPLSAFVKVPPQITLQPVSKTVNPGAAVTLTVAATGSPTLTYQWRRDARNIVGATKASYPIPKATEAYQGIYDVVVTNLVGSATSEGARIEVNDPVVLTKPAPVTVAVGRPAVFSTQAKGSPPITYQWRRNGVNIAGATDAMLSLPSTLLTQGGTYSVLASNMVGSVASAGALLTVVDAHNPPQITKQPLAKTLNPGAAVAFTVEAVGSPTLKYQWRRNGVNIVGATKAAYSIAKVAETSQGMYDVVITNIVGVTTSETVALEVNDPVSLPKLASAAAAIGSPVVFEAHATGTPPITYQWRKNGIKIAGATQPTYAIPRAQISDLGAYSVVATNALKTVVSTNASLSLVDSTVKSFVMPSEGQVTLPAVFAGPVTSYVWTKDRVALPVNARIIGGKTKALTIKNLHGSSPDDSGLYRCTAITPGGLLEATVKLVVYSQPPLVTPGSSVMPDGIVGGVYSGFSIPFDAAESRTPTSFAASGLPVGLVVNPLTGFISGRPAVPLTKNTTYTVKVTATNGKGTTMGTAKLLIRPIQGGIMGNYTASLPRDAALNENLGGRVDITMSNAALFSGKVTAGGASFPFNGNLITDLSGAVNPTGSCTIKRPAPAKPLRLVFEIDVSNGLLVNGHLTDGTADLPITGWRNAWGSASLPAAAALLKPFTGYYTFGLDIPADLAGMESVPQGMGFGSFTVAAAGSLMVTGHLADGTPFATSTFCGPHGEVLLYQALYAAKGSVCGALSIRLGTDSTYANSILTGSPDWLHPAMTAGHNYAAGFGPVTLLPYGGRYVAPKSPAIVMGLVNRGTTNNARLTFAEGGISDTRTSPAIDLRINAASSVARPKINPCSTSLAVNPGRGNFSGGFTLTDANLVDPRGKAVVRKCVFQGMMVHGEAGWLSAGYFLLAKRPQAAPQTSAMADILSGLVELQAQ